MVEYNEEGISNLCYGVLVQAVRDYRIALLKHDTRTAKECERFFRSEWLGVFTDLDGNVIVETIRKRTCRNDG